MVTKRLFSAINALTKNGACISSHFRTIVKIDANWLSAEMSQFAQNPFSNLVREGSPVMALLPGWGQSSSASRFLWWGYHRGHNFEKDMDMEMKFFKRIIDGLKWIGGQVVVRLIVEFVKDAALEIFESRWAGVNWCCYLQPSTRLANILAHTISCGLKCKHPRTAILGRFQ